MIRYFTLIFSFLLLSMTQAQALGCSTTNASSIAVGSTCGTLGETRLLSDGSAIIACLISDPETEGDSKACAWGYVASLITGGALSGTQCGMAYTTVAATGYVKETNSTHAYCSYPSEGTVSQTAQCGGQNVVSVLFGQTGIPSDYKYLGLYYRSYGGNYSQYVYARDNCPEGYTLINWTVSSALTPNNPSSFADCTPLKYAFACVKD